MARVVQGHGRLGDALRGADAAPQRVDLGDDREAVAAAEAARVVVGHGLDLRGHAPRDAERRAARRRERRDGALGQQAPQRERVVVGLELAERHGQALGARHAELERVELAQRDVGVDVARQREDVREALVLAALVLERGQRQLRRVGLVARAAAERREDARQVLLRIRPQGLALEVELERQRKRAEQVRDAPDPRAAHLLLVERHVVRRVARRRHELLPHAPALPVALVGRVRAEDEQQTQRGPQQRHRGADARGGPAALAEARDEPVLPGARELDEAVAQRHDEGPGRQRLEGIGDLSHHEALAERQEHAPPVPRRAPAVAAPVVDDAAVVRGDGAAHRVVLLPQHVDLVDVALEHVDGLGPAERAQDPGRLRLQGRPQLADDFGGLVVLGAGLGEVRELAQRRRAVVVRVDLAPELGHLPLRRPQAQAIQRELQLHAVQRRLAHVVGLVEVRPRRARLRRLLRRPRDRRADARARNAQGMGCGGEEQ